MSSDANGFRPTLNIPGYVFHDDGFPENCAAYDISDGSVWRAPHLFQAEFFNSSLVRSDGCTFDAYVVLFNGLRRVNRYLVICVVTMFNPKIEVLDIEIQVGKNELVFDEFPDDSCHLIAIELDYRVRNFYFSHCRLDLNCCKYNKPSLSLSRLLAKKSGKVKATEKMHFSMAFGLVEQSLTLVKNCFVLK